MELVRAAGGVLWRPAPVGVEVCLVHRPQRDDWTLPKGKLYPGEHPLVGAVREVAEETGVRGTPLLRLPGLSYRLPDGTPKSVDFWAMRAEGPAGSTDDEVDGMDWLPVDEAVRRASYPGDARLLQHFAAQPQVTAGLVLVRHGHAGKRGTFPGPDDARPLDARGAAQANALGALLCVLRPARLVSARPLRCVQTLQPLAGRSGLTVEVDPAFDEPAVVERVPEQAALAARRLAELAAAGVPLVVCSQGKVVPPLLTRLATEGDAGLAGGGDAGRFRTPKGTGWLLSFAGTQLVALDRLAP